MAEHGQSGHKAGGAESSKSTRSSVGEVYSPYSQWAANRHGNYGKDPHCQVQGLSPERLTGQEQVWGFKG